MSNIKYGYIIDSSASISEKEMEKNNIHKVCFDISDSNGNTYEDDNKSLTHNDIISKLDSGIIFKSNAVTPGKVMLLLEDIANKYDKIIVFTISSGLSSFNQNIQYLLDEYKDKLYIVDTSEIGYGIRNIVFETKKMLEVDKKPIDEVINFATSQFKYNFTMFTCKSWEPLRKSGRAPSFLAKTFDILKTKPLIRFEIKNKLGGVATSFKKQVSKIIENFFSTFKNIDLSKVKHVVLYNNNIDNEDALYIKNELSKKLNIKLESIIEDVAPNLVLIYTANKSFGIHIGTQQN